MAKFAKKVDTMENTDGTVTGVNDAAITTMTEPTVARSRVAPVLTGISNAVPIPVVKNNRGSKGAYSFDALEIGQSFGIQNRNAKQMASIVSNANKRFLVNKTDETGAIVFKTTKATDGNGGLVNVPTNEPEKVASRRFIVLNVDPATDPDQASVRVWRET